MCRLELSMKMQREVTGVPPVMNQAKLQIQRRMSRTSWITIFCGYRKLLELMDFVQGNFFS